MFCFPLFVAQDLLVPLRDKENQGEIKKALRGPFERVSVNLRENKTPNDGVPALQELLKRIIEIDVDITESRVVFMKRRRQFVF